MIRAENFHIIFADPDKEKPRRDVWRLAFGVWRSAFGVSFGGHPNGAQNRS